MTTLNKAMQRKCGCEKNVFCCQSHAHPKQIYPLSRSGHWKIIEGNACQRTIHHDGTAKAEYENYDAVFPTHPFVIRALSLHKELVEAVQCVIPLLRIANYPNKKDSPLIERFEKLVAAAQGRVDE